MFTNEIRRRLAAAGIDPARESEIVQELSGHLDDRYADLVRGGMPADEARAAALDELLDDAMMREQLVVTERREPPVVPAAEPLHGAWLAGLWQDVRYSIRLLRANWSFTLLAVLTLALGIGATTAVYAVIDHVLFRPLAYRDADRLARIAELDARYPDRRISPTYANFERWQQRNRTLDAIAIYNSGSLTLVDGESERVSAARVTPQFFAANGVAPARGRGFTEADSAPGAERVLILSDGAWHRRFGADPAVVGRPVQTTAGVYTIVGVLPQATFFWGTSDFWIPLTRPAGASVDFNQHPVLARLKDGVSFAQATADLDAIMRAVADEHGVAPRVTIGMMPLREMTVGHLRSTLYMLFAAVGCILLIACINVAGLLVARGASRGRELGVRVALGASRWRIARQLLVESVLLSLAGAAAGTLLAWALLGALVPLLPVALPSVTPVAVDGRVLLIAIAASLLCGALCGLVPAARLSRAGGRRESHQSTSRWSRRTGKALVLIEVALCLVLLSGAGLMVRTMMALYAVDSGINANGVLVMQTLPVLPVDAEPQRAVRFYRELVAGVVSVPGVQAAAAIDTAPFSLSTSFAILVPEDGARRVSVSPRSVTPGYFKTMTIPLSAGREFTEADRAGARQAVIVNQAAADLLWPGQSPLGRSIRYPGRSGPGDPHEVVGVVGNVRHQGFDRDIMPEVYHPYGQRPAPEMTVVVKGDPSVAALLPAQTSDLPERALTRTVTTFDAMIDRTTEDQRHRAMLLAIVAGLGLLLAAVGVFGLTVHTVSQRTREIGIRVALGAARRQVLGAVMGGLAMPVAIGLVLGLFGAWAASRSVASFLFGVEPTDPVSFVAAALCLTVVAVVACYVPARRALRVDPVIALRSE